MPTIHAVDTAGHDITTIDWTGDGQPLWISVRPNLRRIHVLAGDILHGLGKRRDVGGRGRNESVDVRLATAWLHAHRVPALVVVDAQRLDPRIMKSLLSLATNADADLWLLHRPPRDDTFLRTLARRSDDEQPLDAVPTPTAPRPVAQAVIDDLPAVPPHDFHVFEAAVEQNLASEAAATVIAELRSHARAVTNDLQRAANPAATVADALVQVLHDAPPDNRLVTQVRAVQVAAWHHDLHVSVNLTTLLNSEERPRLRPADAGTALATYRQPYRAITWLLAAHGAGLGDAAAIPLNSALPDGTSIITSSGTITVPEDLRAAVRAQRILRIVDGAGDADPLLPHSPKTLSYALSDAANDLGLASHGRVAERTTVSDTAWLKKFDIQIRPLP